MARNCHCSPFSSDWHRAWCHSPLSVCHIRPHLAFPPLSSPLASQSPSATWPDLTLSCSGTTSFSIFLPVPHLSVTPLFSWPAMNVLLLSWDLCATVPSNPGTSFLMSFKPGLRSHPLSSTGSGGGVGEVSAFTWRSKGAWDTSLKLHHHHNCLLMSVPAPPLPHPRDSGTLDGPSFGFKYGGQ